MNKRNLHDQALEVLDSNISENLLCRDSQWWCDKRYQCHNGQNLFSTLTPIHTQKIQCKPPLCYIIGSTLRSRQTLHYHKRVVFREKTIGQRKQIETFLLVTSKTAASLLFNLLERSKTLQNQLLKWNIKLNLKISNPLEQSGIFFRT